MKRLGIAIGVLAAITSRPALPAPLEMGAQSAECKEIATRLIETTNATFDHYSPSGNDVFLKNPAMVLSCMMHHLTGVSLTWDNSGVPPNAWFALLARAGKVVTGVDVRALEAASHKCHRAALKAESELSASDIPNAKIECQAFTRDGGGVNIHIWMNDHEARKGVEEP